MYKGGGRAISFAKYRIDQEKASDNFRPTKFFHNFTNPKTRAKTRKLRLRLNKEGQKTKTRLLKERKKKTKTPLHR